MLGRCQACARHMLGMPVYARHVGGTKYQTMLWPIHYARHILNMCYTTAKPPCWAYTKHKVHFVRHIMHRKAGQAYIILCSNTNEAHSCKQRVCENINLTTLQSCNMSQRPSRPIHHMRQNQSPTKDNTPKPKTNTNNNYTKTKHNRTTRNNSAQAPFPEHT